MVKKKVNANEGRKDIYCYPTTTMRAFLLPFKLYIIFLPTILSNSKVQT